MASPRWVGGWRALGLLAASLLAGFFLASSCAVARPLPGILKVGLVAPFSGRHYSTGYSLLFAARLALREWNQRGGVGGYRLELLAQDDANSASGGLLQARKMVLDPDVIGVIGHPSDDSASSAGYGDSEPDLPGGFPALAFVAFGPTGTAEDDGDLWTLRLNADDEVIARFVAQVATETLKVRRAALFGGAGQGSSRQTQAVARALSEAGVTVVYQRSLPQYTADYVLEVKEAAEAAPDLVFFAGPFDQGATLLRQLRQARVEAIFLGGPGMANPEFALMAAENARGAYYLSLAPHPWDMPQAQEFRARYRALSGQEPDAMAALAYDAINILLVAAERALSSSGRSDLRGAIVAEINATENFPGVTGSVTARSHERVGTRVYLYRLDGPSFPGQLVTPRP